MRLFLLISLFLANLSNLAYADDDLFHLSLEQLANIEVTSASLSSESLKETPVPVTVITEQMIQQSSARNIKDLLLAYVPNFTHITDQNEPNIAARGIFTSSQQKILIMIDGHRLNSRSYSMASPDYAISLDKIKQIEVLRGPSSSLYGNVALTATINIKLKSGKDLNSSLASLTLGNQGHKQLNYLYGSEYQEVDTLLWAQFFQAKGDKTNISPENNYSAQPINAAYARIDAYDDKPTYDLGAKLSYKSWQFYLNTRQSHYIEPFSGGGLTGEAYKYDEIPLYQDTGPGFGWKALHVNLQHQQQLSDITWHNEIYTDNNQVETVVIIDPANKTYGTPFWQERSAGLLSHLTFNSNKTNYLVGLQIDSMKVTGSSFNLGQTNENSRSSLAPFPLLEPGNEKIYSLFGQLKYQLDKGWLINVGARYDHKKRHKSDNLNNISPRFALIYSGENEFNFKVSYATSFVDATYWNRFSQLSSFRGAQDLKPEKLASLQLTPSITLFDEALFLATNVYYNKLDDFIFRDNSAGIDQPNYSNSGELTSWGVELESRYQHRDITIHSTIGFQQAISSERFATTHNEVNNVPSISASIVSSWQVNDKLFSSITMRYIGKQHSPINIQSNGIAVNDPYPNSGVNFYKPNNTVDDTLLFNAKLAYDITKTLQTSLTFHNMLDTSYQQGGTSLHPYPQAGRNVRASLLYKF